MKLLNLAFCILAFIVAVCLWIKAEAAPPVMQPLYWGLGFLNMGVVMIICNQQYKK
jgi:hypothetical protein